MGVPPGARSWSVRTDADVDIEAGRLSRELNYGLLSITAEEIQSRYTIEAIDRVVPGVLLRSRIQRRLN